MNIKIYKKQDLNADQLSYVDQRIPDDCHEDDTGPITCWNTYTNGLYAAIDQESG